MPPASRQTWQNTIFFPSYSQAFQRNKDRWSVLTRDLFHLTTPPILWPFQSSCGWNVASSHRNYSQTWGEVPPPALTFCGSSLCVCWARVPMVSVPRWVLCVALGRSTRNSSSSQAVCWQVTLGARQHRVRSWAQFPLSTPWLELLSARAAWAWHGQAQPARPPSPPAATARACWMEGRREEKQELLFGIASAQNWEKKWKLNKRDCL